jgi:hypothetical protein
MRKRGLNILTTSFMALLAACTLPAYGKPSMTPTLMAFPTLNTVPPTIVPTLQSATTLSPNPFPTIAVTVGSSIPITQALSNNFCSDAQATGLIDSFKSALQTSNGTLFASLVSPVHGLDARLYRTGRVVNYDREHARFLFDTTYPVNWGIAPGSGLDTTGSFHDLLVPALLDVFNKQYTLTCNQIQIGGATYQAAWPYTGINFYSIYYPGSQDNGSLDWHTWLLGMTYTNGNPYLYAIMQFQWEP